MRSIIVAALAVVSVSGLVTATARADDDPAPAPVEDERTVMVVVGDSISSSYTRTGLGDKHAWWAFLAERIDAEPTVLAQGGSGFLRRGARCTGTSFLQRIDANPDAIRGADVVILEGGVNDRLHCLQKRRNGRGDAPSNVARLEAVVRPTLDRVAELAAPDATVIVTVPWGNAKRIAAPRWWVTKVIKRETESRGFEYVDTSTEAIRHRHRTLDGIHPNEEGSKQIYKRIYYRSSLND